LPTYEYRCPTCHKTIVLKRPFDERDIPIRCDECDVPFLRAITRPNFNINHSRYDDPIEDFQFEHLQRD
jgi:putative FmdB family regulatory protein